MAPFAADSIKSCMAFFFLLLARDNGVALIPFCKDTDMQAQDGQPSGDS
jgi:hypothetical protein